MWVFSMQFARWLNFKAIACLLAVGLVWFASERFWFSTTSTGVYHAGEGNIGMSQELYYVYCS